jgi:hypothetical protein
VVDQPLQAHLRAMGEVCQQHVPVRRYYSERKHFESYLTFKTHLNELAPLCE